MLDFHYTMKPQQWQPRYSGPNRSGICVCSHPWDQHHLGMVMNAKYAEATKEAYVPQECEAEGHNESGGMMRGPDGEWVEHCSYYRDTLEMIEHPYDCKCEYHA
jgi:hypothetical protein